MITFKQFLESDDIDDMVSKYHSTRRYSFLTMIQTHEGTAEEHAKELAKKYGLVMKVVPDGVTDHMEAFKHIEFIGTLESLKKMLKQGLYYDAKAIKRISGDFKLLESDDIDDLVSSVSKFADASYTLEYETKRWHPDYIREQAKKHNLITQGGKHVETWADPQTRRYTITLIGRKKDLQAFTKEMGSPATGIKRLKESDDIDDMIDPKDREERWQISLDWGGNTWTKGQLDRVKRDIHKWGATVVKQEHGFFTIIGTEKELKDVLDYAYYDEPQDDSVNRTFDEKAEKL